jgi:uncharacterized ferredoxin-like protein
MEKTMVQQARKLEREPDVVYIAGPMTNIPEYNFPAFYKAEELIRKRYPNAKVFNPARRDIDAGVDPNAMEFKTHHDFKRLRRDCMKRDTAAILDNTPDTDVRDSCLLVLLPGFKQSHGVAVECALCAYLDWSITFIEQFVTGE